MLIIQGEVPFIEAGDDWRECAEALWRAGYSGEFAFAGPPEADQVESAALAGFMPMSFPQDGGPTLFLPKLHLERCLLDPAEAHASRTARRESGRYELSLNAAFGEVLDGCARFHGEGWLGPELRGVFGELHAGRDRRRAAWISVELWLDGVLAAGEIGYLIGGAYASLSGFKTVSGAGSVQLAALGALLAREGVRVWDLGMPMDYKLAIGGRILARDAYLPALRDAYGSPRPDALVAAGSPSPCREVFERACGYSRYGG